jgi:hypothetical protein
VPENVYAEQQLKEYGRQCPKEHQREICPLCFAEEEEVGEEEPEEGKETSRQVYKEFIPGGIFS